MSEHVLIRVDEDNPFEAAALVGCGVLTGWGSAVTPPTSSRVTPLPSMGRVVESSVDPSARRGDLAFGPAQSS